MAVNVLPFRFPGIPGVRCAFHIRYQPPQTQPEQTSRNTPIPPLQAPPDFSGGNISHDVGDNSEEVTENRRRLLQVLGVGTWCELRQVHGDRLIFDPCSIPPEGAVSEKTKAALPPQGHTGIAGSEARAATMPEADGSATDIPGRVLVIKTADCQPILLAHKEGQHIAALHVGWRGNRIGFIETAVTRFCDQYGLRPAEIMAVRGPSLGPAMAEFTNFATEWGADWTPWYDTARQTMDLWQLTRHQLQCAGLPASHIFGLDLCTHSLPERFFSYRRNRRCGRQAALVWIEGAT